MQEKNKSKYYQTVVNSAIGTFLAEIVTLPICTVKTNYQNSSHISPLEICKKLYKNGGLKSFYSASVPAITSQVFSTSCKFTLYQYFEEQNYKYSNKMINGSISGLITSLVTHPIDTIKIHIQMGTPFIPELKKYGIGLFYRGYSKSLSKILVASSLFYPVYDYAYQTYRNAFYASFISAVVSTTIMHPIDYLKTRHIYGLSLYQGWNPLSYYKGFSVNLARIVPNFIIIMVSIDYLKTNPII